MWTFLTLMLLIKNFLYGYDDRNTWNEGGIMTGSGEPPPSVLSVKACNWSGEGGTPSTLNPTTFNAGRAIESPPLRLEAILFYAENRSNRHSVIAPLQLLHIRRCYDDIIIYDGKTQENDWNKNHIAVAWTTLQRKKKKMPITVMQLSYGSWSRWSLFRWNAPFSCLHYKLVWDIAYINILITRCQGSCPLLKWAEDRRHGACDGWIAAEPQKLLLMHAFIAWAMR